MIDFKNPVKVHFIGIGGISMSGLAELLSRKGFSVSGSDVKKSKVTEHLENIGIEVMYGQRASNIKEGIDLVVYTAAVKSDNPEFIAANEAGIPMMERAELVGDIMLMYKRSYAISGTHGKTTTTSMLSMIALDADLDPTISVGGILGSIGGNMRIGSSPNFIVEACEYTNSFLKFHPTRAGILNIEAEHLDFFKDLDDIRHSFKAFAELLPSDGVLAVNGHIEGLDELTDGLACKITTFGIPAEGEHFDIEAKDIVFDEKGHPNYELFEQGQSLGRICLSVVGIHSVLDSLCAIALARFDGISFEHIQTALEAYTGTQRRFEYKGEIGGVTVIDDYAHHPSEIRATLAAAQNVPHKKLWVVFQPHTYSRTKMFLHDFARELSIADHIVLTDIYAAREIDPGDISSKDIAALLANDFGKEVNHFSSFDETENFLLSNCEPGDVLITMGAGDVVNIGDSLLGR